MSAPASWTPRAASPGRRVATERNAAGPGAWVRGVEFNGLTGMTGTEDRDWPVLDPAFGLAERLGCDGIWFRHATGVEFLTQDAESARRSRELARDPAWEPPDGPAAARPGRCRYSSAPTRVFTS